MLTLSRRIYCKYDHPLFYKIGNNYLVILLSERWLVMPYNIQYCRRFAINFIRYIKTTRFIKSRHGFIDDLLNPVSIFLNDTGNFRIQSFFLWKRANYF